MRTTRGDRRQKSAPPLRETPERAKAPPRGVSSNFRAVDPNPISSSRRGRHRHRPDGNKYTTDFAMLVGHARKVTGRSRSGGEGTLHAMPHRLEA
jgi:hypothetical protein